MKTLYVFKAGRPAYVDSSVKNEDGSETITRNKVYEDVEVYIKKPSHREIDEMDLFYSIQISDLQSKGVATRTMILNSYEDSGGVDSKAEVNAVKKLLSDIQDKRNKFLKNHADGIVDDELLNEIKEMSVKLEEYQQNLQSVFDRSAESMAERRVHLWATFQFVFVKDGETFKPLFGNGTFDQKLDLYYDMLDDEEGKFEFENKVFTKANILLASWMRKRVQTEEEFKLLESYIDEEFNDQ